jgi:hypothetical protein
MSSPHRGREVDVHWRWICRRGYAADNRVIARRSDVKEQRQRQDNGHNRSGIEMMQTNAEGGAFGHFFVVEVEGEGRDRQICTSAACVLQTWKQEE